MITQKELKKILHYDPNTGLFINITTGYRNSTKIGSIAGSKYSNGYIVIKIKGKRYGAHRLAFLYMEGSLPENNVDHIDHVRDNNAWSNLRKVTHAENMQNVTKEYGKNKSGLIGITELTTMKRRKKWGAHIVIDGKSKSLGVYLTKEEAHAAYVSAKRKLHPFNTL